MLLLRLSLLLGGLALLVLLILWALTRERGYLRGFVRISQVVAILLLAFLGIRFTARLWGLP